MIRNYIKAAFRNILRYKSNYAIQVSGFALALCCVILILSWVRFERSFDSFHVNRNRLCRVLMDINYAGENSFNLALTPPPLADAIRDRFPEIIRSTRYEYCHKVLFRVDDNSNYENNGAYADPAFLEMFTFPFTMGNPETALNDPHSIVLSQSLAKKYFGQKLAESHGSNKRCPIKSDRCFPGCAG